MRTLLLLPLFPLLLLLLPAGAEEDGLKRYANPAINLELRYRPTWRKGPATEDYQFNCIRTGQRLMLGGVESDQQVDALRREIRGYFAEAFDHVAPVVEKEITVGGARALYDDLLVADGGQRERVLLVVFCHQGIAYRLVASRLPGKDAAFEAEMRDLLASVAFLEDRPGWLARWRGEPVPTVLAGGLLRATFNRPRWRETTADERADWSYLEEATFAFLGGGAWINLRMRAAVISAEAERDRLMADCLSRLKQGTGERVQFTTAVGEAPGFAVRGTYEGVERELHGVVLVADGLAAHLQVEWDVGHARELAADWAAMSASFTLRTAAGERPAYPAQWPDRDRGHPAWSALIARARRVLPAVDENILACARDGGRILIGTEEGAWTVALDGAGRRDVLPLASGPGAWAAWSPDGGRVACARGSELVIATLQPAAERTIALAVDGADFLGDDLVAVTRPEDIGDWRLRPNRLVRIGVDGVARDLATWPMARFALPRAAPDGARLAFVANRDRPRGEDGGNLFVCAADGSGLRRLTEGAESWSSLAWTADGAALVGIRRSALDERGRLAAHGSSEVWRIEIATGATRRLAAGLPLFAVFPVADGLICEPENWRVADAQRGLWLVPWAALPEPPPATPAVVPAQRAAALTADVRTRLGAGAVGWRPTAEGLAAAAEAFAEAARAAGIALDFSRDSLREIDAAARVFGIGSGAEAEVVLAAGAYYGETLRRACGAEWTLRDATFVPVAVARWDSNPLVRVVHPFSDVLWAAADSEDAGVLTEPEDGQRLRLVHPPGAGAAVLDEATDPRHRAAWAALDAGDAAAMVAALRDLVAAHPANDALAREALAMCTALGAAAEADALAEAAVAAGARAPALLARRADRLLASDPVAAFALYRDAASAADGAGRTSRILLALGKACAATGDRPLAEACWRRAVRSAHGAVEEELKTLLGWITPAPGEAAPAAAAAPAPLAEPEPAPAIP